MNKSSPDLEHGPATLFRSTGAGGHECEWMTCHILSLVYNNKTYSMEMIWPDDFGRLPILDLECEIRIIFRIYDGISQEGVEGFDLFAKLTGCLSQGYI